MEALLSETIDAGLKTKVLSRASLQRLNVDTTVQDESSGVPNGLEASPDGGEVGERIKRL